MSALGPSSSVPPGAVQAASSSNTMLRIRWPLNRDLGGDGAAMPLSPRGVAPKPPLPPAAPSAIVATTAPRGAPKPSLSPIPIPPAFWVPDSSSAECTAPDCRDPFTLLNRRHHCRTCGRLYCSHCTSKQLTTTATGEVIRVCHQCYLDHGLAVARRRSRADPKLLSFVKLVAAAAGAPRHQRTQSALVVGSATPPVPSSGPASVTASPAPAPCLPAVKSSARSRGVFKLTPSSILVRIATYLPLGRLALDSFSALSSDFYFPARDNRVWEDRVARISCRRHRADAALSAREMDRRGPLVDATGGNGLVSSQQLTSASGNTPNPTTARPLPPSTTDISPPGRRDPVASAATAAAGYRLQFSAFAEYVRLLCEERLDKTTTRAARLQRLFTNGLALFLLGPENIGKSALADCCVSVPFGGDVGAVVLNRQSNAVPATTFAGGGGPTMGVRTLTKAFGVMTDVASQPPDAAASEATSLPAKAVTATFYDTSGHPRYKAIWRLLAASSHVIVLCYDVHDRFTLAAAAQCMEALEPMLTHQVVIACGIDRGGHRVAKSSGGRRSSRARAGSGTKAEAHSAAAEGPHADVDTIEPNSAMALSPRCVASVRCELHATSATDFVETALQATLGTIWTTTRRPVNNGTMRSAGGLMRPSPVDIICL